MSVAARLSPRARREFLDIVAGMDSRQAAVRLRTAIQTAAETIGHFPDIGRTRADLPDPRFRLYSVPGFPYVVVYDCMARPPVIARIVHGRRDLPSALQT